MIQAEWEHWQADNQTTAVLTGLEASNRQRLPRRPAIPTGGRPGPEIETSPFHGTRLLKSPKP